MTTNYNTEPATAILDNAGISIMAGWLTVYAVEPIQKEFTQTSLEYLPVGVGLPALSYADKPAVLPDTGFALVRNEEGSAWVFIEDHRKDVVYNTKTGECQPVIKLGALPLGVTTQAQSTQYDKWNGSAWVTDTVAQQDAKVSVAKSELAERQRVATIAIAPLDDAVTLGMATDSEQRLLQAFKTYRVLLSRINVESDKEIIWPEIPA